VARHVAEQATYAEVREIEGAGHLAVALGGGVVAVRLTRFLAGGLSRY